MKPFLYRVVAQYYKHHKEDIQDFSFVFPNKRAGLFFQKYLVELIEKPIFQPEILSISDCFCKSTDYISIDRTDALFELFDIYQMKSIRKETFDTFVYWGEQLLADFDEVDKFLIDARQIFTNIKSLNQLNNYDYLTENQKKAIADFWGCFATNPSETDTAQQDFLYLWELMLPIYEEFQHRLIKKGVATEGMMAREVAEKMKNGTDIPTFLLQRKFVFIGFNVLNACEQVLFDRLQKLGIADFYWDYESVELTDTNSPTAKYSTENPTRYSSNYPIEKDTIPMSERSIKLISVPSSIGQTKEVYRILDAISTQKTDSHEWEKTAVILPDEHLLLPMLTSIPPHVDSINITMGYPLSASPIADFIQHVFDLQLKKSNQGRFYHTTVNNLLNHRYLNRFLSEKIYPIQQEIITKNLLYVPATIFEGSDVLCTIFSPTITRENLLQYLLDVLQCVKLQFYQSAELEETDPMDKSFIYQYEQTITRLQDVLELTTKDYPIEINTQVRIVKQLVDGVSLPFEGEPLNGLQLMGVLETRVLDFENLVMCSFNEGTYPQSTLKNSFIPYLLRKAFGLTTSEYHDAVQAYNFYRLISRARNIYLLYDSRTDGLNSGNVSRFAKQLQYYHKANIVYEYLSYDIRIGEEQPIVIEKEGEVVELLNTYLSDGKRALSASAINTYLSCPLKFYFSYLKQLTEPDEISESIEPSTFGSIVHRVLENTYNAEKGSVISIQKLDVMIRQKVTLQKEIAAAFHELYFKKNPTEIPTELDGYVLLIAKVVEKYVLQIFEKDKLYAPFTYVDSEKKLQLCYPIADGKEVNLKGFVDRIDRKDEVIRIVDYKSGNEQSDFVSLEDVFDKSLGKKRPSFVLQIYLYCYMYQMIEKTYTATDYRIKPSLYYIRNVFNPTFDVGIYRKKSRQKVCVDDFMPDRAEFCDRLCGVLNEIFDLSQPFVQCEDRELCTYCPFKTICGR